MAEELIYPLQVEELTVESTKENKYPELGITIRNDTEITSENGNVIFTCKFGEKIKAVYPCGLIIVGRKGEPRRIIKLKKADPTSDKKVYTGVEEVATDVDSIEDLGGIYCLYLKTKNPSERRRIYMDQEGNTFGKDLNILYDSRKNSPNGRYLGIEASNYAEPEGKKHYLLYIDLENPKNGLRPLEVTASLRGRISNDGYAIYTTWDNIRQTEQEALYSINDRRELARADSISIHGVGEDEAWKGRTVSIKSDYQNKTKISGLFKLDDNFTSLIKPKNLEISTGESACLPYYPYIIISDPLREKDSSYCLGLVCQDAEGKDELRFFIEDEETQEGGFVKKLDMPFNYSSIDIFPNAGIAVLGNRDCHGEIVYHPVDNKIIRSSGKVTVENNIVIVSEFGKGGKKVYTAYLSTPNDIVQIPTITRVSDFGIHGQEPQQSDLLAAPNGNALLVKRRPGTIREMELRKRTLGDNKKD